MNLLDSNSREGYIFRAFLIMFGDILSVAVSFVLGLWIRYDFTMSKIDPRYLSNLPHFIVYACFVVIIVYYLFHLYQSIWRFASVTEGYRILLAYIVIAPLFMLGNRLVELRIPRVALFIAYIFCGASCIAIRFGYRLLRYVFREEAHESPYQTLIVGGGQAAREIIKDIMLGRHVEYKIKAIVDDNRSKQGRYLEGIKIVGNRYDIPRIVKRERINTIIYAISDATSEDKKAILNICKETGCKIQVVPSLFGLVSGKINVTKLRDVRIADLLGRDEVQVNNEEILQDMTGKTVLVTGGGGSIGSELCRQIATTKPKLLIIFDIYENCAYAIQQELKRKYPELNMLVLIGSVRDEGRINGIMEKYRPDIVYHAAAHKHVPLMEDSPCEAVKNNVLGTYKVARVAQKYGVKRFLLISTDKAVNPTNIMGASKRLCEIIIQTLAKRDKAAISDSGLVSRESESIASNESKNAAEGTIFSAVRFGNVLGSNGSVIPLFRQQIAEGGPVTVTDKNVVRYFMTIPEAVTLILQAAHYAKGGEIFVLDMGKPVKIDDMARDLIKLSGLTPDKDIEIVYTGLRPGEKLYEELLMDEEGLTKTQNELIYIGHPIDFDENAMETVLAKLETIANSESEKMKQAVAEVVTTYKVSNKQ